MTSRHAAVLSLDVVDICVETPDVKTLVLDNRAGRFPAHQAGQHLKVRVTLAGREHWKSFTISSSPTQPEFVKLTIKRNPFGSVSGWLHDQLVVGDVLSVNGPRGRFILDPAQHTEPLIWIAAGIGITPLLSMLRCLAACDAGRECRLVYGARHEADVFFAAELREIQHRMPHLHASFGLTQPLSGWQGLRGRFLADAEAEGNLLNRLRSGPADQTLAQSRCYLCCPGDLNRRLSAVLQNAGVPADRIHCEQFFKSDKRRGGLNQHSDFC